MNRNQAKKHAKMIATALKEGRIDVCEAETLIAELEFILGQSHIFEWLAYYFPEKFTKNFCKDLHLYLVSIRNLSETFTLAPRDHAKSTIMCFGIPIYQVINEPDTYRHYLNIQETATKALTTNMNIRRALERNERIKADYGDLVGKTKWTEKQFILTTGHIFSCAGVGESIRGLNVDNIRPDFVVVDDIYELSDAENPTAVRKKVAWYDSDVIPALADDSQGQMVSIHNIGTAINQEDHIHIAEKRRGAVFKRFQAVINQERRKTLWKPYGWLMKKKERLGSITFAREFQNEVRDDATAIIKMADIRYYDGRQFPSRFEAETIQRRDALPEPPEHIEWNRAAIDPAEKTKEINDFTAKAGVIKTNLQNYYIYDITNEKLSFNANLLAIRAWCERFNFERVTIETNKGHALFDELLRTTSLPLQGKHEKQDKITRKIAQSAKFENHKVFISMLIPDELRKELVDQLTLNTPPHDDISDAVINCLEDQTIEFYFGG